jgi:hypothetical protein
MLECKDLVERLESEERSEKEGGQDQEVMLERWGHREMLGTLD